MNKKGECGGKKILWPSNVILDVIFVVIRKSQQLHCTGFFSLIDYGDVFWVCVMTCRFIYYGMEKGIIIGFCGSARQ